VSRTGIITTYLVLRLVVRRGFLDTYFSLVPLAESSSSSYCSFAYSALASFRDGYVGVGVFPQRGNPLSDSCIKFLRESQPPCMEVRNDPPEYRVTSIARRYIHAFFLRRNPQHAGCGDGRQYAGAVAISFTQSDAPDVTSASASLKRGCGV
jgi:hypothetical protein